MPFPKGVKKVAAVFDRADVVITATERILGLLGIIDDEQAVILDKLEQILAKREFEPGGAHAWASVRAALEDIWQTVYNGNAAENDHYGTDLGYLSRNEAAVSSVHDALNNVGDAVGDVWARTVRYLPMSNEGNIGDPTALEGDGDGSVPADCMAALVSIDEVPVRWGHTAAAIPVYQPLGHFTFGHAGRWGHNQELRFKDNWFAVSPATDSYRYWLLPGITATITFRTVSG